MSNSFWALAIIAILAALTLLTRIASPRVLLIVTGHNAVWGGAILLVGSDLIQYQESSTTAWLTLILGLLFFNLGAILAASSAPQCQELSRPRTSPGPLLSRRVLLLLLIMYGVGFTIYVVVVAREFGFSALLTNPGSIRGAQGESYLATVPLAARMLLYLGPILFVVLGYREAVSRPLPLLVRLAGVAIVGLTMLAMLQRTNLFMGILWLAALVISRDRSPIKSQRVDNSAAKATHVRQSRTKVALPAIAFGVLLLAAFQFVGVALNKTGQQALSTGAVSPVLADSGLTSPFTYYTAGTVAFLQLADSSNTAWPPSVAPGEILTGDYNPQTWGAATFAPLLNIVPLAKPWNPIDPFIDTGVLTNVYTWMEPFYRDFRVFGVVLGTFSLGFITGWMYTRRYASSRIFWLQGLMFAIVLFAPFVSKVNNNLFLASVLIVLILSIRRRGAGIRRTLDRSTFEMRYGGAVTPNE